jgi:hypothetical protein
MVALTAASQAGDRVATFVRRQSSAYVPPRGTPKHFDMKSERQDERIALCWSGEGCACAPLFNAARASIARTGESAARGYPDIRIE